MFRGQKTRQSRLFVTVGHIVVVVPGKLLPFEVLRLLLGILRYREAGTSFSQNGIVCYGLFLLPVIRTLPIICPVIETTDL